MGVSGACAAAAARGSTVEMVAVMAWERLSRLDRANLLGDRIRLLGSA